MLIQRKKFFLSKINSMLRKLDEKIWHELNKQGKDFLVFKHSNSCPISAAAKEVVDKVALKKDIYMVVVQDDRGLSDLIASDLSLKHESPQLIRVSDGKVLKQASHYDISEENYL